MGYRKYCLRRMRAVRVRRSLQDLGGFNRRIQRLELMARSPVISTGLTPFPALRSCWMSELYTGNITGQTSAPITGRTPSKKTLGQPSTP